MRERAFFLFRVSTSFNQKWLQYCLVAGIVLPVGFTGSKIGHLLALAALSIAAGCGSLIDEAARVEKAYELKAGLVPQVAATDPADNSFAPVNQTYVDVSFSNAIDAASFSAQSTFGACSGTFQLSYDGFTNCLGGTVDTAANPRIRFTPTVFPKGLGLQIRVAGVLSPAGNTVTTYTSPVGFRLAAPCGNQNCFFSYSTPLMTSAGVNSGLFQIRTGVHAGKFIAYTSGTTTTTLIDLAAGTSVTGPVLCAAAGISTHNFFISSGAYPQQQLVVLGGGDGTCRYDPAAHAFVTGPTLPFDAGQGSHSLQPRTGGESGNTFVVRGASSNEITRYQASTGDFDAAANASNPVGNGGHAVRISTGINAGRFVVLHAGSTTGTTLTTENPLAVGMGPNASAGIGADSGSFEVTTGARAGQIITTLGNGASASNSFNGTTLAVGSSGPALTAALGNGALTLRGDDARPLTNPLIIHAGGHLTSAYEADSGNFIAGPYATGLVGAGSASAFAQNGAGANFFLLINGAGGANTSIYMADTRRFHGSRLPRSVPNNGAHTFYVSSGVNRGKTIVVAAGITVDTAVFDPLEFQFSYGPQLTGVAYSSSFNFTMTHGPHAGKTLVFLAGNTATLNFYDPATNTFSTPVGWPTSGTLNNMTQGAGAFRIGTTDLVMIINGNGATTQVLNQSTGAIAAGPAMPCSALSSAFNLRVPVPNTSDVRQLIFCDGNQFAVFDHASQNFIGAISSVAGAGPGIQGFVLPSGANAGSAMVVLGNSAPTPYIFNPTANTFTASGLSLATCAPGGVNTGSQLLPLTSGNNSGRFLIIAGNTTTSSCLVDPIANTITAGPIVTASASPAHQVTQGSFAFRTNGGLYPTAFIVASGANKNVWNAYVP